MMYNPGGMAGSTLYGTGGNEPKVTGAGVLSQEEINKQVEESKKKADESKQGSSSDTSSSESSGSSYSSSGVSTSGQEDTSGYSNSSNIYEQLASGGYVDLNSLYSTIFPIGGIDDNNKYIDLPGNKINSVQLVEPSLKVSEFLLTQKDLQDTDNVTYKYAYRIPMISIDDFLIHPVDLCAFKLDYTGFIPTVMLEFVDGSNSLLSTNIPKDGSTIRIYIGGHGDELYYKPIRQDFVLTSIRKIGGSTIKYRVYGKLNVPYGYRKEAWCGGECNSMQALFNVAVWTGLGFSTNFTKSNTPDTMAWRNNETSTYFEFMENIANHACYSPNTFFTAFVDQYNVLNFVECHSLLSHGGQKTDVPAMIYKCYPPQELPPFNPEKDEKTTENQLPLKKGDDPMNNVHQKLSYYFISNDIFFDGWTNYIESFYEISNNNSSLKDGFKTNVMYSDSNLGDWGFSVCNFHIRPIDNLKRDSATQKILPIAKEPTQNSYIPLNLIQITKEEYLDKQSSVDNMTNVESFNNFGEIDTSNMFKLYYFAEVQNRYQLKYMKKCGLVVKLQNYNPAITKFSRIWVDIFDNNMFSNTQISKSEIYDGIDIGDLKNYKEQKNKNILKFKGEGMFKGITEEQDPEKDESNRSKTVWPQYIFNRGLSGWYVVTGIEIDYSPDDNNLKMTLTLNRIEYQPCFKDEYYKAKKAIDKYKDDNIAEHILTSA